LKSHCTSGNGTTLPFFDPENFVDVRTASHAGAGREGWSEGRAADINDKEWGNMAMGEILTP